MATMYVSEFSDVGHIGGTVPSGSEPSTDQVVTYTGTAGVSTAFKPSTKLVRIHVDGIASILFGTAPTAVANTNKRLTAGQTEYFVIPPLTTPLKVSAVTST